MRDLKNAAAIYLKAFLFLGLGIASAVLLLLEVPTLKGALLLALCVWAFCRLYYFAFYVIEKYVDSQYRYSGLISFVRYWLCRRRKDSVSHHLLAPVLMALTMAATHAWSQTPGFLPGHRVLMDAHNCYPYEGLWTDRVDRALSAGVPLAIEIDLIWNPAPTSSVLRLVVCHGGKAKGNEPTLEKWFFENVRPLVEKALKEGNRGQWPLITLNINDLRANNSEFFTALWTLMGAHESWLCTAARTADLRQAAPLEVKPILVLTSDGTHQRKTFYEDVPVGGRLRMFATGKPDRNADNFCRWVNYDWKAVEPEGQSKAGGWSAEDAARLKSLVDNAHQRGYWIRFYTLNGHGMLDIVRHGWTPSYNFGSAEAVALRWQAAKSAGVDFVASDQYEECAKVLRGK